MVLALQSTLSLMKSCPFFFFFFDNCLWFTMFLLYKVDGYLGILMFLVNIHKWEDLNGKFKDQTQVHFMTINTRV